MFSLGEGADLVFLPVAVWGQIKKRWFITQASEESNAPMILAEEAGSTQMSYIYNEPVVTSPKTVLETLFPDASAADAEKFGLYFAGNNLIFNPTLGNSIESNGVPYQTSAFSLPVGSDREYDALVQYLQANAWVGIKLSADAQTMHVYGGPRGYFPKADEVAEMLFSGNNDAKARPLRRSRLQRPTTQSSTLRSVSRRPTRTRSVTLWVTSRTAHAKRTAPK